MKLPLGIDLRLPGRGRRRPLISDELFIRGLAVGAVIGAAIAGSTIWSRVRDGRRTEDPAGAPPPSP